MDEEAVTCPDFWTLQHVEPQQCTETEFIPCGLRRKMQRAENAFLTEISGQQGEYVAQNRAQSEENCDF